MIGALVARWGVRRTYDALNARDLDRFLAAWAEEATFTFPGDVPASGTVSGKAAVRAWFEDFLARFPHLVFHMRELCVGRPWALGTTNEVAAHWEIELTNRDGVSNTNSGVTLIRIRRGKVVSARDFIASTGDDFRRVWGDPPPRDTAPGAAQPSDRTK